MDTWYSEASSGQVVNYLNWNTMVDELHIGHTGGISGSYLGHSGNTDIHYPSSLITAWLDNVYQASGVGVSSGDFNYISSAIISGGQIYTGYTPTADSDVITKGYADTHYSGGGGTSDVSGETTQLNTYIGYYAGSSIAVGAQNNVLVGVEAGREITVADTNIAVGNYSLAYVSSESDGNVGIGHQALPQLEYPGYSGGSYNTAIGYQVLNDFVEGDNNVSIGANALRFLQSGNNNVGVGQSAGYQLASGGSNIFIGYQAGPEGTTLIDNKLFINNSNSDYPLIYGEFDNSIIKFGNSSDDWTATLVAGYISSQYISSGRIITTHTPTEDEDVITKGYADSNYGDVDAGQNFAYNYIVFQSGSYYKAQHGTSGSIDSTSTDATTVIQHAIDNIPDNGGIIFIKPGNYLVSGLDASGRSGMCLIGSGWDYHPDNRAYGTVFRVSGTLDEDGCILNFEHARRGVIRDIAFQGSGQGIGIRTGGGSNADNELHKLALMRLDYGIKDNPNLSNGIYDSTFLESYFFSCNQAAIVLRESADAFYGTTFFYNNQAVRINTDTAANHLFNGCVFTSNDIDFFMSSQHIRMNVDSCWFENEGTYSLGAGSGYYISSNRTNAGLRGLTFDKCHFSNHGNFDFDWVWNDDLRYIYINNCSFTNWDDWDTRFPDHASCTIRESLRRDTSVGRHEYPEVRRYISSQTISGGSVYTGYLSANTSNIIGETSSQVTLSSGLTSDDSIYHDGIATDMYLDSVPESVLVSGSEYQIAYQSSQLAMYNLSDDTSPQLGGDLDVNGYEISGIAVPTHNSGAANKYYVDEYATLNTAGFVVAAGYFDGDNGNSNKAANLSCVRNGTGDYTLSFGVNRPTANYIVIGQIIEPTSTKDDIKIHVVEGTQSVSGFDVAIYEGDNSSSPDTDVDRDFYITVVDWITGSPPPSGVGYTPYLYPDDCEIAPNDVNRIFFSGQGATVLYSGANTIIFSSQAGYPSSMGNSLSGAFWGHSSNTNIHFTSSQIYEDFYPSSLGNSISGSYYGHSSNSTIHFTSGQLYEDFYPSTNGNTLNSSYEGHSGNADLHFPSSNLTGWLDNVYAPSGIVSDTSGAVTLASGLAATVNIYHDGEASTLYLVSSAEYSEAYAHSGHTILELGLTDSTAASGSHIHPASDVTSGEFDDGRISQSSVTQYSSNLTITESQINDLGAYTTSTGTVSSWGDISSSAYAELDTIYYPSTNGNTLNVSYTGHSGNADIHYPSSQLTGWLDDVYAQSGAVGGASGANYAYDYVIYSSSGYKAQKGSDQSQVATSTYLNGVYKYCVEALTGGGKIYIATGDYLASSSLLDYGISNIELSLSPGAIIKLGDSVNDHLLDLTRVDHWNIYGGKWDGNNWNQAAPTGTVSHILYMEGCHDIYIHDTEVYGACRYGIESVGEEAYRAYNIQIYNNDVHDCCWNPISVEDYHDNTYIHHNHCWNAGDVGIAATAIAYTSIDEASYGVIVDSNIVHDILWASGSGDTQWGIAQEGPGKHYSIINNIVYSAAKGIIVSNETYGEGNTIIANNHVYGIQSTAQQGSDNQSITVRHKSCQVLGNHIYLDETYKWGIYLGGSCKDSIVANNFISGGSTCGGIILEGVPDTIVEGNRIVKGTGGSWCIGLEGAGTDDNVIRGNYLTGRGISLDGSVSNTIIENNHLSGCSPKFSDSASNTYYRENHGALTSSSTYTLISSQGIQCDWISSNTGAGGGGLTHISGDTQITSWDETDFTNSGLKWDGSNWIAQAFGAGSTPPGGSDTQVQYNNGGSFGGDSNFTYNDSSGMVDITSTLNKYYALRLFAQENENVKFRIGGEENNTWGFYFLYSGAGSGDANYLELYADSSDSWIPFRHMRWHQDEREIDFFSHIIMQDGKRIYGGESSGDDLYLCANQTNTYPYLALEGNTHTQLRLNGTSNFRLYSDSTPFLHMWENNNDSIIKGCNVSGYDMYIYPTTADAYPYIRMTGSGSISLKTNDNQYISSNTGIYCDWVSSNTIAGAGRATVSTKTSNYEAAHNEIILASANASHIRIDLPGSPSNGDEIVIKRIDDNAGTYNVTISGNGNTIDGSNTVSVAYQWAAYKVISDGSNYYII